MTTETDRLPTTAHRVPAGLVVEDVAPGSRVTLQARSLVVGEVVGFVCLTPGLWLHTLQVGSTPIRFSNDGFPSEAAQAPGLLTFPGIGVVIGEDVMAVFENTGLTNLRPRSYFLIEIEERTGTYSG